MTITKDYITISQTLQLDLKATKVLVHKFGQK